MVGRAWNKKRPTATDSVGKGKKKDKAKQKNARQKNKGHTELTSSERVLLSYQQYR